MRPFLCLLALAICVLTASESFADHSGVFSGRRIQRAKQRGGKVLAKGKAAVGFIVGKLGCG